MDHLQALLAAQFPTLRFLQWAEFDGDREVFTVIHNGRVIRADSLPLLLAELRAGDRSPCTPLRLAA